MEKLTYFITFENASAAEANRYAEELRHIILEASPDVIVQRQRDDPHSQASPPEAKQLSGAHVQADIDQQNEKRTQWVKKDAAHISASEAATIQPVQPGQYYLTAIILGVFLSLVSMLFLHLMPIWTGVDPSPTPLQALPLP